MTDTSVMLEQVRQHWEYIAKDIERSHAMYHEDAVLEFPQSGERFEGLATFKEWRAQYPANLRFRIRRMTAREDLVVVECSISYDDGPWQFGVQLLDFRDDKVERERIYVMEGLGRARVAGPVARGHSCRPCRCGLNQR